MVYTPDLEMNELAHVWREMEETEIITYQGQDPRDGRREMEEDGKSGRRKREARCTKIRGERSRERGIGNIIIACVIPRYVSI